MSIVRGLDKNGITVLDVWSESVVIDYFGQVRRRKSQTPPLEYPQRPMRSPALETRPGGQAPRPIRSPGAKRGRPAAVQTRTVCASAAPSGLLPGKDAVAPLRTDDGRAYLGEFDVERVVQPTTPFSGEDDLPQYETGRLDMEIDSISFNCVQGTVTMAEQQRDTCLARYTCLALRDLGMVRLPPRVNTTSWIYSTLSSMGRANQIRAAMAPERREEELRIPKLVGLVFHTRTRDGQTDSHSRLLVGGLLQHMKAPTSWDSLRRCDQPPSRERHMRWAEQIRVTIGLLHEHGMVRGGHAVHHGMDSAGERLMASVDVDADDQPWLVRHFDGAAYSEDIVEKDRQAVAEMMQKAD